MAENSSLKVNVAQPVVGLNLNGTNQQVGQGEVTWAVNAIVENFNGESISYQNEQANILCASPIQGYRVIGQRNIIEKGIIVLWLVNPDTGDSEIGTIEDCEYSTKINAICLGFDINYPILKTAVKITNCTIEVYFTDGLNGRRYIDLLNLPFVEEDGCPPTITTAIDCNKLEVQPNFAIPSLEVLEVDTDGDLTAGTVQFAIQYSNALGEGYTSYYSVTNPLSLFDINKITLDFNYGVGKSLDVKIDNLDISGYYDYFNLAVIKTINNIASVELVGTFQITSSSRIVSYTGQNKESIKLTVDNIFEKFPIYDTAQDLTVAQDILIWDQLTTSERISYQKIANQISLQWQTWRLRGDKTYRNELNTANFKGYMRDEIYAPNIVFLLANGKQTDAFPIPGRVATPFDLEPVSNNDVISTDQDKCDPPTGNSLPRWKVYNTGNVQGTVDIPDDCYEGEYQYGEFGYYESTDTYPCNPEVYGELSNQSIRLPRFPDSLISHIHDNDGFIYPIGFRINVSQIKELINSSSLTIEQKAQIVGFKIVRGNRANNKSIIAKGLINNVGIYERDNQTYFFPNYTYNDLRQDPFLASSATDNDSGSNGDKRLDAFSTNDSQKRYTLHSPDTSFYQPFLGNILKLETVEHGLSEGHFVEVKDHSKYKFLSSGSYAAALVIAVAAGIISSAPITGNVFDGAAAIAVFNTLTDIIEKLTPFRNFAYQHTSVGKYSNFTPVSNNGSKQRFVDLSAYLQPGIVSVGDEHNINNYQRESSVYLRTTSTLPYPHTIPGVPEDQSRWILSEEDNCDTPRDIESKPISSYYSSIKRSIPNQYGQVGTYDIIDTGFQMMLDDIDADDPYRTVFGGDIFINRFAYKSKLPFFIDNRVGKQFANESDVEYDKLSNVANTIFWFSTDSTNDDTGSFSFLDGLRQFFGIKINNFDCKGNKFFYQTGKIYLFAYGLPYFFCESEVNVDMRQAFNNKEGDYYPRVGEGIPDDWLQEVNTTIQQDNSYHYNKTYSKQNKENLFTQLPDDFSEEDCTKVLTHTAIFSEKQGDIVNYKRNNWLIYRPAAKIDLPQNYGRLISLEGIENRVVLARFENKSLLYNALLTAPTSAADVYLGQSLFSQQVPPLDFADTDLGYVGSQHKLFIKTEYGHVTTDAKRGQIFLIQGNKAKDITGEEEKVSKFFTEFLGFEIQKAFPEVNADNHFNGIGLHGVYDNKYDRLIITKLDYKPLFSDIQHENGKFYKDGEEIQLTDTDYFCNYSFTASYAFNLGRWVSFHTYVPNFYIGDSNYFYSGINNGSSSVWRHNTEVARFNNFYGEIHPYTIEYPFSFKGQDEILHSVKDYTKVFQYTDFQTFIETDDYYYTECVLYNNQQSSGVLILKKKPKNNLSEYGKYPKYNTNSKEVIFTKSNNFYNLNTFWSLTKSAKQPIWKKSCQNLSIFKELNQDNCDYSKRSFKKAPLMAKDLKIRFTLNDRDDIKMVSQFLLTETQTSFK